MKSYQLKTIKDIFTAVNEKNIDGFLKDFEAWLRLTVEAKKIDFPGMKLVDSGFTWNDDGEYGEVKSINFEIKKVQP